MQTRVQLANSLLQRFERRAGLARAHVKLFEFCRRSENQLRAEDHAAVRDRPTPQIGIVSRVERDVLGQPDGLQRGRWKRLSRTGESERTPDAGGVSEKRAGPGVQGQNDVSRMNGFAVALDRELRLQGNFLNGAAFQNNGAA